ncbi:MAG: acetate--CoA ligase family protein, partial [Patescibacteria group bacterium]
LSKIKPVAILKAGQSEAGALAAMSHTGSIAGSNEAVLAGFKRTGVIVLENIEEMFDLLLFYSKHKKIKGDDVVLISNAGGPMVATVDLLSKNGVSLNKFSRELVEELKETLPKIVKIKDPLDIIGDADAGRFKDAIEAVLEDKKVSNVLILLTPQTSTEVKKTAEIITSLAAHHKDKVIFTSFMGGKSVKNAKAILEKGGITNFDFPNKDVNMLTKIINYENDRKKLRVYKRIPAQEHKRRGEQLDYIETFKILKKFGIPAVETHKVTGQNDLKIMSYPAVLKAVGKKIIHKTEKRAVALGIKNKQEAEKKLKELKRILEDKSYCVSQPMVAGDIEMIVGFRRDRSFGPIIMVGMGGIYTEVFKDVQLGVDDISNADIRDMIEKLKIYPILKGARGKRGYNLKILDKIISGVARMAQKRRDIHELDINPVILKGDKAIALDARIVI